MDLNNTDPDMWWDTLATDRKRSIMRWLNPGATGGHKPGPDDVPLFNEDGEVDATVAAS